MSRVYTQPTRINTKTNITELQPVKTEMHPIVERVPRPIKDFANSVKFLKLDDSTDKLLNGMPVFDDELDE